MTWRLTLLAVMMASACVGDETVAGYGGAGKIWVLDELDGAAFSAHATMTFPKRNQIAGAAPCNSYGGEMSTPYPWFDAPALASTRRACPELAAEQKFLTALGEMTQSEVLGNVLILRNDAGREMVFKAGD
ncbi:MAG: META domain-containing protein [Sedimentitalea sp.]